MKKEQPVIDPKHQRTDIKQAYLIRTLLSKENQKLHGAQESVLILSKKEA